MGTKCLVLSSISIAASTFTAFHLTHKDAVNEDIQLHPSCANDKCMQEFCVKQNCFYSILMNQTLLDMTEPEFDSVPEACESQYWQHGEICIVRSTVKCVLFTNYY